MADEQEKKEGVEGEILEGEEIKDEGEVEEVVPEV